MNRTGKTVLIVVVVLFGLCLLAVTIPVAGLGAAGALIARNSVTEPGQVAAIAGDMAGYSLPDGYRHQFAARLLGFSVVSCAPEGYPGHIYLMQFPAALGLDQASMQQQMEQATGQAGEAGHGRIAIVGTRQATIRGQEVTLQLGEGTNSAQQPYRELTGVFQGRNGRVLLNMSAPTSHWGPATIDAFLASIT